MTQTSEELIRSIIQRIAVGPDRGKDISQDDAYQATLALLDNTLDPIHAALFLIGLRMKRESMEEYLGIFQGLNASLNTTECEVENLLYLADPFDGYIRNVPTSAFLPPILAACDMPCVIQGVEQVGPKFGVTAHQVYKQLGIDTLSTISEAKTSIETPDIAWAYLDQTLSHPKLAELNTFRHTIVKRSALTTLERVLLPIKAKQNYLALGFVHKAYPEIYGTIAQAAGFDKAILIKGMEGGVTPALNKPIRSFEVNQSNIANKEVDELAGKLPNDKELVLSSDCSSQQLALRTAEMGIDALKKQSGTFYEILIHNAAYLLWKFKNNKQEIHSFHSCINNVKTQISTGSVLNRLKM